MKSIYIGAVRNFITVGDVIPVFFEGKEIAYGIIKQSKVLPSSGEHENENFLPLAVAELRRERPDIQWEWS